MPFDLELKSIIVGMLLAMFVIPYVRGMLAVRVSAASDK